MTTEPSARVTVNEKPMPGVNTDELTSEANTKKPPPSATAKLTVPVPALSSAPSRLAAAPRAQFAVAGSVSQTPPPLAVCRSSSRVSVRAPLPAWRVTWKVPSSAPSAVRAELPCPTLSRSLPRNATLIVGADRPTVKPPGLTADWPSGFETVTSRGPRAAVVAIARATESWVDETTVVEVTVTPAPKEALAPAWKFAPVTLTVRLAPGAPELGDTLAIVGTVKVTVATAEEPSAKLAVSVKLAPLLNCVGLKSEANTKKTPPSATVKLTVPVPALSSAASRLAAAPRAQFAVAGSVSQTPPLQPVKVEPAAGAAVSVTAVPLVKLAEQVAPQLIPAGALVTVPLPVPAGVTVRVKLCRVKVAVTVVAAESVTVQGPVPEQPPPLQPVKVEPATGVAVNVTAVPLAKLAEQVAPQLIPTGALVTVPLPVPALLTVSVNVWSVNVVVTVVAAESVTVQAPVPEQPPPLQPVKVEPAAGVAVNVTAVPLVKLAAQVAPQLIPAGALVTVPLPVPAGVTVKVKA